MKAPKEVVLKEDAQVMLVKNIDSELVNGCVGRVLGFWRVKDCAESVGVKVESKLESETGSGKSQSSASVQAATAKNGGLVRNVRVGADGRTPIALFEARLSASSEETLSANKENIQTPPTKTEKNGKEKKPLSAAAAAKEELFPLVEFRTASASGIGVEIALIGREEFKVEDNEGKLLARRVQVSYSQVLIACTRALTMC